MMADDVGTTYFSYRGPSPHDLANGGQGHRNTIRSEHSAISSRGDNNEITTLAVRPYQSSVPGTPPHPSQNILLLSPPYPGYFPPAQPYITPHYSPYDSMGRDGSEERSNIMSHKVHSDFTKSTETLRQCALVMGIVFLLVFGAAIFMAVYYGSQK